MYTNIEKFEKFFLKKLPVIKIIFFRVNERKCFKKSCFNHFDCKKEKNK